MRRIDDFTKRTKELLAKRVNNCCSNMSCGRKTSGPKLESSEGTVSIGVASHITAASPGGPRYDATMASTARRSIENAIWLCQTCAKLIDGDPLKYTEVVIREWKRNAEQSTSQDLERRHIISEPTFSDEQLIAFHDILIGALESYDRNMIVFGTRNGWDVVTLCGDNYSTSQDERLLYVDVMTELVVSGIARLRGSTAYELSYKGRQLAKRLQASGIVRNKPGTLFPVIESV